jgi:hypothetical protein
VTIEDVNGDLNDLLGSEIVQADEESNEKDTGVYEHETWTFYKLSTVKGSVTIRWYGTSNGYYSESAGIYKLSKDQFREV